MIPDLQTRIRQWLILHGRDARIIAILLLVCALFGAVLIDPPRVIGHYVGVVDHVGLRHSPDRPGVRLRVLLPDGGEVWVDTRAKAPALKDGARVCLLRTKGMVTRRVMHQIAPPRRCAAPA